MRHDSGRQRFIAVATLEHGNDATVTVLSGPRGDVGGEAREKGSRYPTPVTLHLVVLVFTCVKAGTK